MNLPDYKDVPFDYEDFINNKLLEVQYNLMILEDFWFMHHPAYNQTIIRECNIAIIQLKAMARIPKKDLDKSRLTKRRECS